MQRFLIVPLFLFFSIISLGQFSKYTYGNIPEDLLEDANSVVRYDSRTVNIPNQSTIDIDHKRVITVINKRGDRDVDAYIHYDEVTRVKSFTATVYDKMGREIKKYKQRDFKDVSAVDGISLYTDSRVLYLDHTPTSYPYTMVIESATTSKNTMAIPSFYANDAYFSSSQEKHLKITYAEELGLRYKTYGDSEDIEIEATPGDLHIKVQNVQPLKPEMYSPGFRNMVGRVSVALDIFHLEGVDGTAQDWKTFGKWVHDNLLVQSQDLPEETATTIRNLVKGIEDPVEKARVVYQFVQDKTRYISVQVGIGGWKPMKASQVDKVGYGDCKALTSYTKALLDAVEVPSYYTLLYGSREKRNIESDFASIQGNHAILSIPNDDDYIWLECTNQNVPFGFIAGFTDDRDVLVVKPEGGEIVHTKKYEPSDNFQKMKGTYTLDASGNVTGTVEIKSGGLQYGDRYHLMKQDEDDKKGHYYDFWGYLNNVKLTNIALENDRKEAIISENISFNVDNYATFAGDEVLVPINLFNRYTAVPDRVKDRRTPVDIFIGFIDTEEVEIKIPVGFEIVALPEKKELSAPFGNYSMEIVQKNPTTLTYKRTFEFLEGKYSSDQYAAFRKFIRTVVRNDQQKLVLKKQ